MIKWYKNYIFTYFLGPSGGRRRKSIFITLPQTPAAGSQNDHIRRTLRHHEKMSANRPKSSRASLCDPANNGHELVKTFSPFAINLHHLCSKDRIIWRILMSYHSSWWTARTLQFYPVSLEISNNQYLFGVSITQINYQDHGLNSSFSTMKSQSPIYFSWFRVWSILTILD